MSWVCLPAMSFLALGWALSAPAARSDVIVLKNGRHIVVDVAVEADDQVKGETSTGQISLPKSIVERIERQPFNPAPSSNSSSNSAPNISIAAPAQTSDFVMDPVVARAAVHDGAIDRAFIAQTEQAALTGEPGAAVRAAAAHYAAAQFEAARGDADAAARQDGEALRFLPNNLGLLLNVAYTHLQHSEYSKALEYLTHARKIAPDSPDVAKLTGWADYGLNRVPEAVSEWKRALQLRPDADITKALERAELDEKSENGFREGETRHFELKYSGAAAPAMANGVLRALESDFDQLSSMLNFAPAEPIGVILYTNQQFEDVTRAPAWVGAINDGRIRVPVQGLESVTDSLARVLMHELTHSFLQQKTMGRAPTWLQEGVAQWMEGRRIAGASTQLLAAYDNHSAIPLSALEVPWMNLSGTGASFAYGWSLAAVEAVLARGGMSDLEKLLDAFTQSPDAEAALHSALYMNYAELDRLTADYLRTK